MNKYAVAGILADAAEGKRFLIVQPDHHAVYRAMQEFGRFVSEHAIPAKVRVANGAERVDIGTGTVRFTTPRSNGMRGLSVDVVFIDNEAHRVLESGGVVNFARFDRFREDIALTLSASGGEIVHS